MYKEAYHMMKRADWWDDTKQFATGAWDDIKKSYNQNKDTWRPWLTAGAAFAGTGLLSSFIKNPTLRFALPWLAGAIGYYGGHMYNQYANKKQAQKWTNQNLKPYYQNNSDWWLGPKRSPNGQVQDPKFRDPNNQLWYGLQNPDYWNRKAQRQIPKYGPRIQNLPKG